MDINQNINHAWLSIVNKIKELDVGDKQKCEAFLPLLKPQAMSGDFLLLTSNNSFIKFWVEKNLITLIKQALYDLYNTEYSVQIEVDNTSSNEINNNSQTSFSNSNYQNSTTNSTGQDINIPKDFNNKEKSSKSYVAASLINNQNDEFYETKNKFETSTSISSLLTFENFVIGNSNNVAFQMARSIAEEPGKNINLNPLFIYGRSGVGKTHLLRAIQNYINKNFDDKKVIYVDSSDFLNDYVDASAAHDSNKESFNIFKLKYISSDVLLVDDIQQLEGRSGTLGMFFNIFNSFINDGKQIIISSDRAPKNIDVDERLQSRFNNGMTCHITSPEVETKIGIIKSYFERYKADMPDFDNYIGDGVIDYIAQNSSSNIRELKSSITKVYYEVKINKEKLNTENIKNLINDHFSKTKRQYINVESIQNCVERYYNIDHKSLLSKKKDRKIANARQIAIYLCFDILDMTTTAIGKKFNRDHSTVIHSINKVEKLKDKSVDIAEEIETLKRMINDV